MNPFEYIRERITEIADTLAAVDGRDPSWGYSDLMELLSNIEEAYNDKYGSSDTVYRSDAIEACYKDYDNILDFRSNGWTVASSFEEILNALPSVQPEHALKDCRNCKHGQYNDHWDTYFCYNSGNCEDWNLWESDIIPSAQPDQQTIAGQKSDLIHRETARRIIDSPRSKSQMLTVLKCTPSVHPENDWIPVTKKAHPDLPIRVQVQISNGWIITAYWEDGNWHSVPDWYGNGTPIEEDDYIKIEAWRELPEPYTEVGKNEP